MFGEGDFAGSVALDQPPDHHGGHRRAGYAGPLPFGLAGDAEQQNAFGDAERGGLCLRVVEGGFAMLREQ